MEGRAADLANLISAYRGENVSGQDRCAIIGTLTKARRPT
jgi:hypothetical protein